MAKNVKSNQEPTHQEIADRAHRIYEAQGRPEGKAMEHWFQAEAQLAAERKVEAGASPATTAAKPAPQAAKPAAAPANTGARPSWQTPARPVTDRN